MARMIDIMQNNGRLYSLPNPDFQHPFKNVRNCGNKRGQIENHLWKKCRREKRATLQRKWFRTIWLTFGRCQLENAWKWLAFTTVAWSAGVFFGRASNFARESAMLKLPEERRKWGESNGAGREKRKRRTFFLSFAPLPPFPPFALAPALRVTISTLRNLPLTKNQRLGLQQCEHELGFAHPKYACTAG